MRHDGDQKLQEKGRALSTTRGSTPVTGKTSGATKTLWEIADDQSQDLFRRTAERDINVSQKKRRNRKREKSCEGETRPPIAGRNISRDTETVKDW